MESVDVNAILGQTIALLDNYARNNNIEIRPDYADDLPIIASDQSQLQQVFLNLLSNAIDAVGKDGLVTLLTRKTDGRIEVSVQDNGPGIPPSVQKRVFDPFFTTKETGKGTGLGLWVSYSIMEKMGGGITLKSAVGEGTRFTVHIPVRAPDHK